MNIKKIRKERGFTQKEIAAVLNVAQNTYSYWENEKYRIDMDSLKKLSKFYSVTVDYLLGVSNNLDASAVPSDLQDIQFAFHNEQIDLSGLTKENIEDLRTVANIMRQRNRQSNEKGSD